MKAVERSTKMLKESESVTDTKSEKIHAVRNSIELITIKHVYNSIFFLKEIIAIM